MGFYIDLSKISMPQLKGMLKSLALIPSWKILLENIDNNFETLKQSGIKNLSDLLKELKTADKIQSFSQLHKIPDKYLIVLNRMVKGYRQKPAKLRDFASINEDVISRLENVGLDNAFKLYERVLTKAERIGLSTELQIDPTEILTLARLSDLSRIRWVNHTFAYVLLMAGYRSAKEIANADPDDLYQNVKRVNEEKEIYPAHIGLNDMRMCIDSAKLLDDELEI